METLQRKKSTPISIANTDVATETPDVGQTGNSDASVSNPDKSESADEDYIDVVNIIVLYVMVESHNAEVNPKPNMNLT